MGRPLKTRQAFKNVLSEERVQLDAALVEGFVRTFLWERFDSPKETPLFHKELWQMCCSSQQFVALAAPRGHAKSTACTLSFVLASVLFGFRDFVVIISATEKQAVDHLKEIHVQLTENEHLIETFGIHKLLKDNDTELVCSVGERIFKIVAKGAEQKLRGIKWRSKRPNLVLIDDLEEDEQVRSQERREKLLDWFMGACLPMGGDDCLFRVLGTILHLDSLLQGLLDDKMWLSKLYKAHRDFDDFTQILWPEKFPESRLRQIRDSLIRKNNSSLYSQEYLNLPIAGADQYFRREWFLPMGPADRMKPMRNYATIDLAISTRDRANRSSISVGGLDQNNMLHIRHNVAGRWDALEIIDQMFEVHEIYEPEIFLVEAGHIEKSIGPFLNAAMIDRGVYLNIVTFRPDKDKPTRARAFQARMRAGGVLFDTEAEWYADLFNEMITFPRGQYDDRVDSTAALGLILDDMQPADSDEETQNAELEYEELMNNMMAGRSKVTGY